MHNSKWTVLFVSVLFLTGCTAEEALTPDNEVEIRFSPLHLSTGTQSASRATSAALAAGSTVRILAYNNSNVFVGEHAYNVGSDGSLTSQTSGALKLRAGTYKFYTVSPALTPKSYSVATPVFDVNHQVDFASSLTSPVTVSKPTGSTDRTQNVSLTQLGRRCSKLTFEVRPDGNISGSEITYTRITKAVISSLPTAPQTATGAGAISPAGQGNSTVTLDADAFSTDANNLRKSQGSTVVLPKTSTSFGLQIWAQFNNTTGILTTFKNGSLPAMAFEAGKEYIFSVRLSEDGKVGLWLTVSSWYSSDQSIDMGGSGNDMPPGPIEVTKFLGIGLWKTVTYRPDMGGDNPK